MIDQSIYGTMQSNGQILFDTQVPCGWCHQMFRITCYMPSGTNSSATVRQEVHDQSRMVTMRMVDMYTNTTFASQVHQCAGVQAPYIASQDSYILSDIQAKVIQLTQTLANQWSEDAQLKTLKSELRTAVGAREVLEDRLKWAEEDSAKWQEKADQALRMLDGIAHAIEAHHPECPDCQGILAVWRKYADD